MRFVIIIVIVTLAVMAGIGMMWFTQVNQQVAESLPVPQMAIPANTADVWVARAEIPLGTVIRRDMVERKTVDATAAAGAILADNENIKLDGMVARAAFRVGEPLKLAYLNAPGDPDFLAGELPKGMRAVTVAVDSISGVAGFVRPGDRVDVLLTHALPGKRASESGENPVVSEVLLADVKVLAVNLRRKSADVPQQPAIPGIPTVPMPAIPALDSEPPGNITVQVSEADAMKLRLAEKNGGLSLALRSVEDQDEKDVAAPVKLSQLPQGWWQDGAPEPAAEDEEVVIVRGVESAEPSAGGTNGVSPLQGMAR